MPSDMPDVRVIVTVSAILASRVLMHNDRGEVNPFRIPHLRVRLQ